MTAAKALFEDVKDNGFLPAHVEQLEDLFDKFSTREDQWGTVHDYVSAALEGQEDLKGQNLLTKFDNGVDIHGLPQRMGVIFGTVIRGEQLRLYPAVAENALHVLSELFALVDPNTIGKAPKTSDQYPYSSELYLAAEDSFAKAYLHDFAALPKNGGDVDLRIWSDTVVDAAERGIAQGVADRLGAAYRELLDSSVRLTSQGLFQLVRGTRTELGAEFLADLGIVHATGGTIFDRVVGEVFDVLDRDPAQVRKGYQTTLGLIGALGAGDEKNAAEAFVRAVDAKIKVRVNAYEADVKTSIEGEPAQNIDPTFAAADMKKVAWLLDVSDEDGKKQYIERVVDGLLYTPQIVGHDFANFFKGVASTDQSSQSYLSAMAKVYEEGRTVRIEDAFTSLGVRTAQNAYDLNAITAGFLQLKLLESAYEPTAFEQVFADYIRVLNWHGLADHYDDGTGISAFAAFENQEYGESVFYDRGVTLLEARLQQNEDDKAAFFTDLKSATAEELPGILEREYDFHHNTLPRDEYLNRGVVITLQLMDIDGFDSFDTLQKLYPADVDLDGQQTGWAAIRQDSAMVWEEVSLAKRMVAILDQDKGSLAGVLQAFRDSEGTENKDTKWHSKDVIKLFNQRPDWDSVKTDYNNAFNDHNEKYEFIQRVLLQAFSHHESKVNPVEE